MMINITETIHSSKMALLSICLFGLRETVHNNPQCGTPATFQNVGFSFGPWWARCRSSVSKVVFGMVQNSVPQDIKNFMPKMTNTWLSHPQSCAPLNESSSASAQVLALGGKVRHCNGSYPIGHMAFWDPWDIHTIHRCHGFPFKMLDPSRSFALQQKTRNHPTMLGTPPPFFHSPK